MNNFSQNIKHLRVSKGFSQGDLANKIGVKRNTVSNYENGRSAPDLDTLGALAKILDVTSDYLIGINSSQQSIVNEPKATYIAKEGVPYFDVDFKGGFDLVFNSQDITPSFYINYPPFNNADCWVNVTGNSMAPSICHGDLVALKKIETRSWHEMLLFGETYAIVCKDFRTIKLIGKGIDDDHFNLIPYSKSKEFSEQQIPKRLIEHVFKVLGAIKTFF